MNFIYLLILLFALDFNCLSAIPERYQLIDLGTSKHKESSTVSINNNGQLCGDLVINNESYVFFWDPVRKLKYLKNRITTMPIINDAGKVFGSYFSRKTYDIWELDQESAYIWDSQTSKSKMQTFGYPSSQSSKPHDLHPKRVCVWDANDKEQILLMNTPTTNEGYLFLSLNNYRTWLYKNGKYNEITNQDFTVATKINNNTQVLVHLYKYNKLYNIQRRFVGIYTHNDQVTQLLDFESDAWGSDINDSGQVVGAYYDPLRSKYKGFLAEQDSQNLVSFDTFIPTALNTQGLLIGYLNEKEKTPAIWDNGCLRVISEVADMVDDNGNTWDSIESLTDVNDRGEIVGNGVYNGAKHAILLQPIN